MGSGLLVVTALLLGGQTVTLEAQATAPGGQSSTPSPQTTAPGGQSTTPSRQTTAPGGQARPPGDQAAAAGGQDQTAAGGQAPAPGGGPATTKSTSQDAPAPQLPVSLEHIRAALARAPEQPRLRGLDRKPDFQVTVEERLKLEELLWSLEFKTGPAPPGGLYAYEQQRLVWNKTDHPLVQPYAAFTSGQLVTLAVEGLGEKYVGGPALNALTGAERKRTKSAARAELARAIAEFCATQTDRSHIEICWMGIAR